MKRFLFIISLGSILFAPQISNACSAFGMKTQNDFIVGKSYDWGNGMGFLIVNKRGVKKSALVNQHCKAESWTSKYGSVSFNQYGRELPLGGMNEKGVVVEVLWLRKTSFQTPSAQDRCINELQLIQYILDNADTTAEALEFARQIKIAQIYAPIHYFICDQKGECGTIEYVDGKIAIHTQKAMPYPAITNSTYQQSKHYVDTRKLKKPLLYTKTSLQRFWQLKRRIEKAKADKLSGKKLTDFSFKTLENVRLSNYSKWNMIYHPKQLSFEFRLAKKNAPILAVDLKRMNFSCKTKVKILDLKGSFTKKWNWIEYKPELNKALIDKSFKKLRAPIPNHLLKALGSYPQQTRCDVF